MNLRNTAPWLIGLVLVGALAVRLAGAVWWQSRLGSPEAFAFPDSESYWYLGRALADNGPYQYGDAHHRIFRMPLYPLCLAITVFLADEPMPLHARWVGALLGTAAVALTMVLAYQLFCRQAALAAGAMAAVHPEMVAASIMVLSEALFCPLIMLQLCTWVSAERAQGGRLHFIWGVVSGSACGLATLTHPSWIAFLPLSAALSLALRPTRRRLEMWMAMVAGMVATMAPWWYRNYQVTGQFVPTTLQVGATLFDSWNPQATGASDMRFVHEAAQPFVANWHANQSKRAESYEYRLDRYLQAEAISWAASHPTRVFQLAMVKVARTWNIWPNEDRFAASSFGSIVVVCYLLTMVGALYGVFRSEGILRWICLLPACYCTCLHLVFVGSIRYRQPAMLALIVLAGFSVARSLAVARSRRERGPR